VRNWRHSFATLHYPHHPRVGERVAVVRTVHHDGCLHYTVDFPDGIRGLLSAWTSEPRAAGLPLVDLLKPPFAGREAVLAYLARCTRRVGISNRRLISMNEAGVTFRSKDYRRDGAARYQRHDV
jgi:hypothetical protein